MTPLFRHGEGRLCAEQSVTTLAMTGYLYDAETGLDPSVTISFPLKPTTGLNGAPSKGINGVHRDQDRFLLVDSMHAPQHFDLLPPVEALGNGSSRSN